MTARFKGRTMLSLALVVTASVIFSSYSGNITAGELPAGESKDTDITGIPVFYLHQADEIAHAVELYHSSWRIHVLDVGQGDAILVQGRGKNILIDGGDKGSAIVNQLVALAVDTLHWVIATHPHADHIAGLVPVMRHFPVHTVMDPGMHHSSNLYRTYKHLVDSAATSYVRGYSGWSYTFADDFNIQVVHPDTLTRYDINNISLVLRVRLGNTYALFTGDAERVAERAMLGRGEVVESQIVKIGHHGSKTSSSKEFMEAVSPVVALISCGANNKYGFPHPETLSLFEQLKLSSFRTDTHSSILVLVNEKGSTIFTGTMPPVSIDAGGQESLGVNINTADMASLMRIVHVGEVTARAIIAARPFTSLDDLQRVRGIGPAKIRDIKNQQLARVR